MGPHLIYECWQGCVWLPFDLRWLFIKSVFDPKLSANEQNHHHVDVDCKLDDSHHGDQDDQDVDQNDDKQDPICIEDDVDDDDENDNHQAIDLQNDDVVGDGHNDDVDNDNETSRKCLPNSLYPPIVNNPTQILSFPLINPKGFALPPENTPRTLSSRWISFYHSLEDP